MKKLSASQWVAMIVLALVVCSAIILQAIYQSFNVKFISLSVVILTFSAYYVFGIFRGIVETLHDEQDIR